MTIMATTVWRTGCLRFQRAPWLSVIRDEQSRARRTFASLQLDPLLVDSAKAPPTFDNSAVVYPNVVTEEEERAILQDLQTKMKRRRFEKGHWDAVIVKYKEVELVEDDGSFSETTRNALNRLRNLLDAQHFAKSPTWLPCHAIELHASGELHAHVDSVRFSGNLVAGLSLFSSSIMRLCPAPPKELVQKGVQQQDNDNTPASVQQETGHVDMLLPPRSMYALTGPSRYLYTHELLQDNAVFEPTQTVVAREDRFSVIFRDAKDDTSRERSNGSK